VAKGIFSKLLTMIGFESEEAVQEDEGADETGAGGDATAEEMAVALDQSPRRRASVVALSQPKNMRMVVTEPTSFEEVQAIALNLRNRRPIIVNLERTDREVARRIVDFLSGATYALGGGMQRVGGAIFLFAPHNVDVATQSRDGTDEMSGPSWPGK
jgi:cell division inhibitor SepF